MSHYRHALPQLSGDVFLTDGGLETTLIFHEGLSLPCFAAFDALQDAAGYATLRKYFSTYAALARQYGVGCILESATWRANPDWGEKLGYTTAALLAANRRAITLLQEVREAYETDTSKMVISGCVGPRGDGYNPATFMSAAEAESYHTPQIAAWRETAADMVSALTMTYAEEAIGIVRAATAIGMPVAISFTVETNGALPSGQALRDAIESVDALTDRAPVYYMLNCAHPTHFADVLRKDEAWVKRLRGLRANASMKSHAELDESVSLDAGNPFELGRQYRALQSILPHVNVLGGCCGTDHRHVEEICKMWLL